MIIFWTIMIIFIFIYGMYIMNKLDISLVKQFNRDEYDTNKVLIYGNNDISKMVKIYLDKCHKGYDILDNITIEDINERHKILLILSDNDLDNLMVYSLGKKIGKIEKAIAVCNNKENKRIYDEYGIINVNSDNSHSDKFLSIIKENIKND